MYSPTHHSTIKIALRKEYERVQAEAPSINRQYRLGCIDEAVAYLEDIRAEARPAKLLTPDQLRAKFI